MTIYDNFSVVIAFYCKAICENEVLPVHEILHLTELEVFHFCPDLLLINFETHFNNVMISMRLQQKSKQILGIF